MKLGFCMCGSFCTHEKALSVLSRLAREHEVIPVLSERAANTDTRFGTSGALIKTVTEICGRKPVTAVVEAEPLGPVERIDMLVICPCTGNTLSKLASGVSDSSVTLAAKATVRADRPVLIALCSNDALGANLKNTGVLLNRKNYYFVPMYMDDKEKKPHSLVCDFSLVEKCVYEAEKGVQVNPVFFSR
ncbi:MAG: dipicolinate synthase subunit B [Clostridia bacterium]|nr:dipicolinate synthase subunit B [Clostridia bacterium]